jgi:gliding motility-associated-like protein
LKAPILIVASGLLVFGVSLHLPAQSHPPCGGSPVPLSTTCADACMVCDLNGVSARTTNTIPGQSPAGYCTQIVHSMQWLAFVAGSANLTLNVAVSGCNQNNGVEMGIYASDDCQTFKLVSNCNTNMYNNQTWSFTNTESLKPGCIYYLVFDGNGPNSCNIQFTVVSGSTVAPVPNTTQKISGKALVCVGETADYSIPPIFGACDYEWRVEGGSLLYSKDEKAQVLWDVPGRGRICVRGTNACHSGNEVCLEVEVGEPSPMTELGPFFVCPGTSYRYQNVLYTAGHWTFQHQNRYGCDSITLLIVENLEPIETWIDTTVCYPDDFVIQNQRIDSSGKYKWVLKSKLSPFCDSTLYVDLLYSRRRARVYKSGDLNCEDTVSILHADTSLSGKGPGVRFVWTNEAGDTLSLADTCRAVTTGRYFLHLRNTPDSLHECASGDSVDVFGSRIPADLVQWDSLWFCPGQAIDPGQLPIRDRNNPGIAVSYHFSPACDSTDLISDSLWLFWSDTMLYAKAGTGYCTDVLPFFIRFFAEEHISIDDQSFCHGTLVDLSSLLHIKDGNFPGGARYFTRPTDDSLFMLLTPPLVEILSDTAFFLFPDSAGCPAFSKVRISARPMPDPGFALSTMDYCEDDSLRIRLQMPRDTANIHWKLNGQTDWVAIASDSAWVFPPVSTGVHELCIRIDLANCIDSTCHQFTVHPLPAMPDAMCETTDSTILFFWNNHPGENYTVDTLKGGTFLRLSDTSILFYGLSRDEEIRLRIRALRPPCGEKTAEIACRSKACPPLTVSLSTPDTICWVPGMQPVSLQASTQPTVAGGRWIWYGKGITDSLAGTFHPDSTGPGNQRVFAVFDYQGCRYAGSTVVVVRENPLSAFLSDTVVCQDSLLIIRFAGSRADSAQFNWDFDGGTATQLSGNREMAVRWSVAGKRRPRLRLNHYRCLDEFFKDVEVLAPLAPPVVECEATDSFIVFSWKRIPRVRNYKVLQIEGLPGNRTSDTSYRIVVQAPNDSASIRLILEDEGPCSEVSSSIIRCRAPDCPVRNAVDDTLLHACANAPLQYDLNVFLQGLYDRHQWAGPRLDQSRVVTEGLPPGKHLFVFQGHSGRCVYTDSIQLEITLPPRWGYADVEPIPCDETKPYGSLKLTNVFSQHAPLLFSIDGKPAQNSPVFTMLSEGVHAFTVHDALGCISDSSFQLTAPEIPHVDIGPNIDLLKGTPVSLHADITGRYSRLEWSSAAVLSCKHCTDPVARPDHDEWVFCSVLGEDGCEAFDTLLLRVFEQRVYAPNAFSPNGDQVNDFFTLFGNMERIRILEIFDRWGNRMFVREDFEGNRQELGWSGRTNGQSCLPGTYLFRAVVQFSQGSDRHLSGDLTIVR